MTRLLAVRLDSAGDVLLTGPALHSLRTGLAADADRLDLLVSPTGAAAARLLPGVDEVLVVDPPWEGQRSPALDPAAIEALVEQLRQRRYDEAIVFTSYHQSPLPFALLARLAGIPRVAGTSDSHPGSLLDVRHRRLGAPAGEVVPDDDGGPRGGHEVAAALALVAATGRPVGVVADARLAVGRPLPEVTHLVPTEPYVVVHPGASVPARAASPARVRAIVAALVDAGWPVVVTGSPAERGLTAAVAAVGRAGVTDLGGRTSLAELAAVLDAAACVVVGNTGPAHLAAAVGSPVVSLFAPVVPVERWGPWGVPSVVLGDQHAPCRLSRARTCPVPGHPCLDAIAPAEVVAAVHRLAGAPTRVVLAESHR